MQVVNDCVHHRTYRKHPGATRCHNMERPCPCFRRKGLPAASGWPLAAGAVPSIHCVVVTWKPLAYAPHAAPVPEHKPGYRSKNLAHDWAAAVIRNATAGLSGDLGRVQINTHVDLNSSQLQPTLQAASDQAFWPAYGPQTAFHHTPAATRTGPTLKWGKQQLHWSMSAREYHGSSRCWQAVQRVTKKASVRVDESCCCGAAVCLGM